MSDVHDNNAMAVDFHEVAERLEGIARDARMSAEEVGTRDVDEGPGVVRQLWEGMVEDVLGRRNRGGAGLA